jgi:hypothetical protein
VCGGGTPLLLLLLKMRLLAASCRSLCASAASL